MLVLAYAKVESDAALRVVEYLAKEIWPEYYTNIIGAAQVDYMLRNFQTTAAIKDQVKEGYIYYLAMYGKIPVGYISVLPDAASHELFMSKLYLLSLYRGQGFGRQSLDFVDKLARTMNLSKVTLMVSKKNLVAISFYEHCGFRIAGPVLKDIGSGFAMDDWSMERDVKSA